MSKKDDLLAIFGERMRISRELSGMSQCDAAEKLGFANSREVAPSV